MVPWHHGTMVPWHHGTMVTRYHGTMLPGYHGYMVTIIHQTSLIDHQPSIINHRSSIIIHRVSIVNQQSSIMKHQSSWYQIMAQMLFGRIWLQNKDLDPSIRAIDIIFRAGSVPTGPRGWGCARDAPHWKLRRAKPPSPPAAGGRDRSIWPGLVAQLGQSKGPDCCGVVWGRLYHTKTLP